MTTQMTTRHPARTGHRTARSLPVVAGIGYSLAWIISLSVGAPNPAVAARGSQVVAAFAGHGGRRWPCSCSPKGSPPPHWPSW